MRQKQQAREQPNRLHPKAEAIRTSAMQLSQEDLKHTTPYNIATEYEALRARHTREMQEFQNMVLDQRLHTYTELTKRETFMTNLDKAFDEFMNATGKKLLREERDLFRDVVKKWGMVTYRKAALNADDRANQKAEKDEKFKKDKALADSMLSGLSAEERQFAGLLEASNIWPQKTSKPDGILANPTEHKKPKTSVPACTVLGALVAKHPNVAKMYGLQLDDSTNAAKPPTPLRRSRTTSRTSNQSAKRASSGSMKSARSRRSSSATSNRSRSSSFHSQSSKKSSQRSSRRSSRQSSRTTSMSSARSSKDKRAASLQKSKKKKKNLPRKNSPHPKKLQDVPNNKSRSKDKDKKDKKPVFRLPSRERKRR
eukprot:TRINITY_DN14600_c0_g1_i1.p1 TRINITY_DN14600_c0_g1~~TRINITY_DN14600_c0_g1_i1.p1  ORF type:complete len:369 (-),score=61.45 TRINITY_DN14600_c0_g1_i1:1008-2114(-)